MFKVTSPIHKYIGIRFVSKALEKPNVTDSFKIDYDINGMTVITIQPKIHTLSKVAAVFNAGSRFEDNKTFGTNHLLRRCVGLASAGISAVNVTRHFQQMGTQLRCIGTRENLSYVVDFSYDLMDKVVELLAHSSTRQSFYNWELRESAKPQMDTDIQYLKRRDFNTLCSELLHEAAYRDGLGNSLFMNENRLGDWKQENIESFLDQTFTANNSMLIGLSVNHDALKKMAENFKIRPLKEKKTIKPIFRGGEIRNDLPIDYTTVSVVWEAPGFNDMKRAFATSILSHIIDSGCNMAIKWNNGSRDFIKQVVKDSKINENCEANSIYSSYSDSGLLGFNVTGCSTVLKDAICQLFSHFTTVGKSGVSTTEFDVAKKAYVIKLLMRCESNEWLMESAISQSTSANDILSTCNIIDMVNSVTIEDVNEVAKTVLSNPNKALAAVGDLYNVPYLHDLKC